MKLLERLERPLRPFAIPNLTLILVFGQSLFLMLGLVRPEFLGGISLIADRVAAGEVWRLVTFIFYPPSMNLLFAAFDLYLIYIMGTALENHWGTFRYNLYLLIGYLATLGIVWIVPGAVATNLYLTGSIFLAFAWLFPDFEILLFFLLPVKVKWLGLIAWLFYGWMFLVGSAMTRLTVAAAVLNFLLFFGPEIIARIRSGHRRMLREGEAIAAREKAFHTCLACGITDKSHPTAEFRYCPECAGTPCYCMEHMQSHTHRQG